MYEHVDEAGACVRCSEIQEISEFVQNNQQYAMMKHYLNRCCTIVIVLFVPQLHFKLVHVRTVRILKFYNGTAVLRQK